MAACSWVFSGCSQFLSKERFEISGWMRIAEGNVSRGRHGACWAYPKCLTPVDWSFLIQHIVILQNLLAQDAVDANTMNKFKKPLEEIRDRRSFKGC